MHTEPSKTRSPASRRARVVLWSVLVAGLVVVLAAPVAIFACLRYSASQKAANIEALEEMGAWVAEHSLEEEEPPEWLVHLLGKENFRYVDNVEIGEIETSPHSREERISRADTEEFLRRVRQFPRVRSLFISTEQVRGAELRELPFFAELRNLQVDAPDFSDEDAQIFRDLKQPESIGIGSPRLTDAGVAALKELHGLQRITIRAPKVTDQGVAFLPLGPDLWTLQLSETSISDAALQRLAAGAPGLRFVHLSRTKVADAGLVHLQSLHQLSHLDLSGTAITDAGLPAIARVASLNLLDLSNTAVTDEGVALLVSLPNLDILELSGTQVTDRAIEALKGAPVSALCLNQTRVTDATLEILASWPKMQALELRGTQVTAQGLRRFTEAHMPGSLASDIDPELWYGRNKADE
jgi:hypothetical protein